MNDQQMFAELRNIHEDRRHVPDAPAVTRQLLALPLRELAPDRGWLPQSPKWRFQSMFSATKFVVAGAIVALFGGFLLVAQPFEQQRGSVPGAALDATSQSAANFWGRFESVVTSADYWERFSTSPEDDGSMWYRDGGGVVTGRSEMSDERLSGEVAWRGPSGVDRWGGWPGEPGTVEVYWGAISIENEEGSWLGHRTEIAINPSVGGDVDMREVEFIELVGSGAYEGWSAILYANQDDIDTNWDPGAGEHDRPGYLVYGAVFPGNLPPDRESYLPD